MKTEIERYLIMKEIKVYVEKDGYLEPEFMYINLVQIITIEQN